MTATPETLERLRFLARVVQRAGGHLRITDTRLFARPMTIERVRLLAKNTQDGEQVDAFSSRFGRLQDSLGAKLLPIYLGATGESAGLLLDNLDLAEKIGLIESADDWMALRRLRNQMVHEYIEAPEVLCDALNKGHQFVPTLLTASTRFQDALHARGWAE